MDVDVDGGEVDVGLCERVRSGLRVCEVRRLFALAFCEGLFGCVFNSFGAAFVEQMCFLKNLDSQYIR